MRFRVWIVCLMLVLLPLRGWAAASMGVPAGMAEVSASAALDAHPAEPEAAPCHDAAPGDAGTGGHVCTLCDLCHGAVADLPSPAPVQVLLPAVAPRPAAARNTGRHAVGGLERPPRNLLA